MLTYRGALDSLRYNQSSVLLSQLTEMKAQAQQEINDQIDNISTKILILAENARNSTGDNTTVDSCLATANADLTNFGTEMTDRLNDCFSNVLETGNLMLMTTWSKVWTSYDVDYQCAKLIVDECKNYALTGPCPSSAVTAVERSKSSTAKVFTLLTNEMVSQVTSMSYPCRQMIVQEMALYPSLILNYVDLCLEKLVGHFLFGC